MEHYVLFPLFLYVLSFLSFESLNIFKHLSWDVHILLRIYILQSIVKNRAAGELKGKAVCDFKLIIRPNLFLASEKK